MKKVLAILLSCVMLITGCSFHDTVDSSSENILAQSEQTTPSDISSNQVSDEQCTYAEEKSEEVSKLSASVDTSSEEYIKNLGFNSLNDPDFLQYIEDSVYADIVEQLDSDEYFVENVEAVYISKEYIEELEYNSQENVYFGYKLSELDKAFQGEKYIFTLGKNGQTDVIPFEEYDDTFDKVIRNVAVGTGVILLCVTVSAVTGGFGAPVVSMIFAASAKSATVFALSSGVMSGVSTGIVEGMKTHDFDKALKEAALKGSEGFMWGACTGAVTGGATEAVALKGATLNGLTMNEAAEIQKESKYPLDVIKQFSKKEQYEICKEAGLTTKMIDGKTALVRDIDLNFVDEATGMTNLERMEKGLAALDPTGTPYELHHVGQHVDSTLAMLTKAEHMQDGNNTIWHVLNRTSEVHIPDNNWDVQRKAFWKAMAKLYA